MSDISSSTPQMMQQQHYVTQTMENSFGPDHIINDLLFPMEPDNNTKPVEYNIGTLIDILSFYLLLISFIYRRS